MNSTDARAGAPLQPGAPVPELEAVVAQRIAKDEHHEDNQNDEVEQQTLGGATPQWRGERVEQYDRVVLVDEQQHRASEDDDVEPYIDLQSEDRDLVAHAHTLPPSPRHDKHCGRPR
jgi:hypothetical protein